MHFRVVVATLVVACVLAGCGFTPKQPRQPDENRRVPVNAAAPYTKPWPPVHPPVEALRALAANMELDTHRMALEAEPPAALQPIAEASSRVSPVPSSAVVSNERTNVEPVLIQTEQPNSLSGVVWPITQYFEPTHRLAEPKSISRVSITWPPMVTPAAAATESAEEPAISQETVPFEPAQTFAVQGQAWTVDPLFKAESRLFVFSDLVHAMSEAAEEDQSEQVQEHLPDVVATESQNSVEQPAPSHDAKADLAIAEPESVDKVDSGPDHTDQLELSQQSWHSTAGVLLGDLLSEWAAREDWIVSWESDTQFRIEVPFSIDAPNFLAAAGRVIQAYIDAGQQLIPVAYSNKVLVIRTR